MKSEEKTTESPGPNPATEGEPVSPCSSLHTPHCIRLGPPWQTTPADGGTRHARKFGRPRTLDANERLWLVCQDIPGAAEVRVNGTLVGSSGVAGPFAVDITSLLGPRNEVVFSVASALALNGVWLEIRTA